MLSVLPVLIDIELNDDKNCWQSFEHWSLVLLEIPGWNGLLTLPNCLVWKPCPLSFPKEKSLVDMNPVSKWAILLTPATYPTLRKS